jgi:hypothetical protein
VPSPELSRFDDCDREFAAEDLTRILYRKRDGIPEDRVAFVCDECRRPHSYGQCFRCELWFPAGCLHELSTAMLRPPYTIESIVRHASRGGATKLVCPDCEDVLGRRSAKLIAAASKTRTTKQPPPVKTRRTRQNPSSPAKPVKSRGAKSSARARAKVSHG